MTAPDFAEVKRLYLMYWDLNLSDRESDRAEAQLVKLIPHVLRDKLDDLGNGDGPADVESPAFEKTFRDFYTNNAAGGISEEYDLLPFDLWNRKLEVSQPADGYQIDQWDRPHATKGRGKRSGPMARQRFWRKTKQGKRQFFHGYRLSINGKRKWVTDRSLALARFNAERKRDGHGEYL